MRTFLDPSRREIDAGGRKYPFRLDCRDDVAAVDVGGREYRVGPLRWRAKLTLARYAAHPELLEEQFVHACTQPSFEELDATEYSVLRTLAEWMNETAGLPFDLRSLTTAMMQLCRATNLRPADFDGLPAMEVEAMWASLGGAVPEALASESSAAGTTILIVPDEERASGKARASAPPEKHANDENHATPANVLNVGRASARPVVHVEEERAGRAEARPASGTRGDSPDVERLKVPGPMPRAEARATSTTPTRAVRFRVSSDPPVRNEVQQQWSGGREPGDPAGGWPLAVGGEEAAGSVLRSTSIDNLALELEPEPVHESLPILEFLDPAPRDAWLDDFADRLERAAADMGIVES